MKQPEQYEFEIPCPHEANGSIPASRTLPNHHPLTGDEIAKLLDFARDHQGDGFALAKVAVRLMQGVPGSVCPNTIDDEVARRRNEVNRVFIRRYKFGGTPDLVEAFEQIMQGQSPTNL